MRNRKTHEEYLEAVSEIHPDIEVIETYINSCTKIKHKCKIDNNVWYSCPSEILRGRGCPKCGRKRIIQAHIKTHDEYIEKIKNNNLSVIPIGRYINSKTKIKHECKKCRYQWDITPSDVLHGYGCPICAHKIIGPYPEYRNSIWSSKYKELAILYGMTEEQMKTIMPKSNKKIEVKCTRCNTLKNIDINTLFSRGFSCPKCSDGISYPNKFMYSLLDQLSVEYNPEFRDEWTSGYVYDIVNEDLSLIIENHGIQHYEEIKFSNSDDTTLKDRESIDNYKMNIAKNYGIKYYIIIDCRRSELEWIKNNIMSSDLPAILNFTEDDIDWNKCHEHALSSKIKSAADLWNNGLTIKEISIQLKICTATVSDYLRKASNIGLCDYKSKDGMQRYNNKRKNRSAA